MSDHWGMEYRSMLLKVSDLISKKDLRRISFVKNLNPREVERVGDDALELIKLMEERDELSINNLRGLRILLKQSLTRRQYVDAKDLIKSFDKTYRRHTNRGSAETLSPCTTPNQDELNKLSQGVRDMRNMNSVDSVDFPDGLPSQYPPHYQSHDGPAAHYAQYAVPQSHYPPHATPPPAYSSAERRPTVDALPVNNLTVIIATSTEHLSRSNPCLYYNTQTQRVSQTFTEAQQAEPTPLHRRTQSARDRRDMIRQHAVDLDDQSPILHAYGSDNSNVNQTKERKPKLLNLKGCFPKLNFRRRKDKTPD